ncbi:MAG: helix-turn-helix domain-containing protein [Polyangiaceae bacterium]
MNPKCFPRPLPHHKVDPASLPALEAKALRLINGKLSVSGLAKIMGVSADELGGMIARLVALGAVEAPDLGVAIPKKSVAPMAASVPPPKKSLPPAKKSVAPKAASVPPLKKSLPPAKKSVP